MVDKENEINATLMRKGKNVPQDKGRRDVGFLEGKGGMRDGP